MPNIANGRIEANDTTYGAVGDVICDHGYNGTVGSVTCLSNGAWSPASCIPLGNVFHTVFALTLKSSCTQMICMLMYFGHLCGWFVDGQFPNCQS